MLTALLAILVLQSSGAQAPPSPTCTAQGLCTVPNWGNGMVSHSISGPAISVPQSAMPPIPLAVPEEPELKPGKHELVVHWPEGEAREDYRRTFKTGAACLKARFAILDEHNARASAIAVNSANKGVILAMVLDPPYAACVPLD
jgi:hypothetical protein